MRALARSVARVDAGTSTLNPAPVVVVHIDHNALFSTHPPVLGGALDAETERRDYRGVHLTPRP